MLVDKEYPATHSMSTSWYIVDEEGNVGIMDFNENGPVPWGTEQIASEDLAWGHYVDKVDLTEEQILYMLGEPQMQEETVFWPHCTIQIDNSKKDLFETLCQGDDIEIEACLSESLGIYEVSCWGSVKFNADDSMYILEKSTLRKLLDDKIIKNVYNNLEFEIDESYENENWIPELKFNKSAYYYYWQPYSPTQLSELVCKPNCPVKVSQLSERMQQRAYHLPIKFKNCPKIQIAEFTPCGVTGLQYDEIERINGCEYALLPLPNGQKAYMLIYDEKQETAFEKGITTQAYQSDKSPLMISVEEMKRLKGL